MASIYMIKNLENGKVYIGQTTQENRRESQHFNLLRRGAHYNTELQEDFNKYGEDNLYFEFIEEVENCDNLGKRESYYCKKYSAVTQGYNINSPEQRYSLKYEEELIISIREDYASGKFFLKDLSEKYNINISTLSQLVSGKLYSHYKGPITKGGAGKQRTKRHKLNKQNVLSIRKGLEEGKSSRFLAKKYSVSTTTIANIKYGDTWKDIGGKIWKRLKTVCDLTDDEILSIRNSYTPYNNTHKELADKFNTTETSIRKIVRGQ